MPCGRLPRRTTFPADTAAQPRPGSCLPAPSAAPPLPPLPRRIRNEDSLLCLPPHDQFRWLHRFYLVLDRIAEQHRVYKLYGGPHGFMISTGVAEADADHAATLLRFSLHLLQAAQSVSAAAAGAALAPGTCCGITAASAPSDPLPPAHMLPQPPRTPPLCSLPVFPCCSLLLLLMMLQIRLAGSVPLDLVMVMASGPATSGLLGTTSLTYQVGDAGRARRQLAAPTRWAAGSARRAADACPRMSSPPRQPDGPCAAVRRPLLPPRLWGGACR